jgi:hypothetical protein
VTTSRQSGLATSGTPLPDPDLIRRAALQASWARDRELARQRLALRWFAWVLVRVLAIGALAAAATWLWLEHRDPSTPNATVTTLDQRPPTPQASGREMVGSPRETDSTTTVSSSQTKDTLGPDGLRLEHGLPASQALSHQTASLPTPRPATGEPPIELRPEPRLHTKEH